jgi:hypothetical protein
MGRDNISHEPLIDFLKNELRKNPKMSQTDAVRLARKKFYNEDESAIQSAFAMVQSEAKMNIWKRGQKFFRGNVGPDSKPIGVISVEPAGAKFIPAPDESFTYQELQHLSELVKQTINANGGTK